MSNIELQEKAVKAATRFIERKAFDDGEISEDEYFAWKDSFKA